MTTPGNTTYSYTDVCELPETAGRTEQIDRDDLAEFLYVVPPRPLRDAQTPVERYARVREWSTGEVAADVVRDCYARADRLIADAAHLMAHTITEAPA